MFSEAIERALEVASEAHSGQQRRNRPGVPYLVHPVHIALMLTRLGCDEVTIVAGILHDVVEDSDWTLSRIEAEFGAEVRVVVGDLTEDKSLSWEERKQWAIDHIPHMDPRARTIKAADKLHNLSSLARDLEAADDPAEVWSAFSRGPAQSLAMSARLVEVLAPLVHPDLRSALRTAIAILERH